MKVDTFRWFRSWLRKYITQGLTQNWLATLDLCEIYPGATLLDIGCGDGTLTAMVCRKVGASKSIGIDVLPDNLHAAMSRSIAAVGSDLDRGLPLADRSVDLVIASHVIEHVCDTDLFVKEIHRVLREGGVVVIATPNLASWPNVMFLMFGQQPPSTNVSDVVPLGLWSRLWGTREITPDGVGHQGSNKHRRLFVRSTLVGLLRHYGFRTEIVAVSGFPPLSGWAAKLACRFFPVYAWQIIVRARKPSHPSF